MGRYAGVAVSIFEPIATLFVEPVVTVAVGLWAHMLATTSGRSGDRWALAVGVFVFLTHRAWDAVWPVLSESVAGRSIVGVLMPVGGSVVAMILVPVLVPRWMDRRVQRAVR